MTISVSQLAHAINTKTRITPLLVRRVSVCGMDSWLINIPYGDAVHLLFPRNYYTCEEAVSEFCRRNNLDRRNVITQIEEEI